MFVLNIVFFAALFASSFAEIAKFQSCDGVVEDICTISEVRITPCKNENKCLFRKKKNVSISFDFTPNFAADKLNTTVYWASPTGDISFAGFGSNDACVYTTCPSKAAESQTLNYSMYINKKLPGGVYKLKWKVWNAANDQQVCCFVTTIEIK